MSSQSSSARRSIIERARLLEAKMGQVPDETVRALLQADVRMLVGVDTEFEVLPGGVVMYKGTPPEFIPAEASDASAEPAWSPDLSFLPESPPDPRKLTAKDAEFLRKPAPERVAFYANLNVGPPGQNWKLKLT